MSIKVAIADDHYMFLMGIKGLLKEEDGIDVTGIASNEVELKELIEKKEIDVVLLDINFGRVNGIDLCKIYSKEKSLKIIALSMHKEGVMIDQMMKAGAMGYVLKDYGANEVVEAINKVVNNEVFLSPKANSALEEYLLNERSKKVVKISKRERDVLSLIMEEYTTTEIGQNLGISKHTVETHRGNLFSKFQVRNLAGLVKKTIELGVLNQDIN